MPLIDIDHTVLHYTDRPADTSVERGVDIVLLHSFGTTARVWEPMLTMLDRRHRVVALDARNHGRSGATNSSSLNDNVSDVIAMVDRLSLDRPVIVGSSVGALVAITAAARAPESVRAVVSVGGASHAPVAIPELAAAMTAMVEGLRTDPESTIASVTPGWFGPLVGPRVHDWVAEQMREMRAEAIAIAIDALIADPRAALAALPVPVHHLHGALDSIPVAIACECAELSPLATITVLEMVAHMPHIEMPGWFAGWLGDLAAAADDDHRPSSSRSGWARS